MNGRVQLEVAGGVFHALELAGRGAAHPRVCLYLHGFPDHPPTAGDFLDAMAGHGHRVVAPWMRGYRPSPVDGPFDLDTLVADVVAIADEVSPGAPVDIVGHDWGAAITYALCLAAPGRVGRAVTLALPHPLTFLKQLRTGAQMKKSWYMALFQLPGSGRAVAARDLALIDLLWRSWSPKLDLDDTQRSELHACIADSLPAPLEYYRAMARPVADLRARIARARTPIATPLLQLHGADDGCVLPPTIDDARRFSGPRVQEIVPGVGHFLQLEQPALIASKASAWLWS